MRRNEVLFAVIGGVVGGVLVMAAGWLSPLGAQNEVRDAKYDSITCRRIWLEGLNGEIYGGMYILGDRGVVYVSSGSYPGMVSMSVSEHGGMSKCETKIGKWRVWTLTNMAGMYTCMARGMIHPEWLWT